MQKELEDKIIQKCSQHNAKSKGKYAVSVADRLFDYKQKYDMKIIEKYKQQMDEEIKTMKKTPKISDKSKAIVKKKSKERKTCNDEQIVNRLMNDAARRQRNTGDINTTKEKINFYQKEFELYEEESDDQHNQTGDCAENLDLSQVTGSYVKNQHANIRVSTNVVDRLYNWGKEKESKLHEIRENYIKEYSFTPRINEVSKMLLELEDPKPQECNKNNKNSNHVNKDTKYECYQMNVNSVRSSSKCKSGKNTPNKYSRKVKKTQNSSPYTFKPQLSKKSLQIAEKLGNSRDRLINPSKYSMNKSTEILSRNQSSKYLYSKTPKSNQQINFSHCNDVANSLEATGSFFNPVINKKSRQIDRKMSNSPFGRNMDRFERLYKYKDQQFARLEALKQIYKRDESPPEEKPKTRSRTPININSVVDRNIQWQIRKETKINNMRVQKETEEAEQCTFKPNVSNNEFSALSNASNGSQQHQYLMTKKSDKSRNSSKDKVCSTKIKSQRQSSKGRYTGYTRPYQNEVLQTNSYSAKSIRDKIVREQMSKCNKSIQGKLHNPKIQQPQQEIHGKQRVFSFSDKQAENQQNEESYSIRESNSSCFNTNKQNELMREIGYLDLVVKATEFDADEETKQPQLDNINSVEEIQKKIDKWKELTSNLETIKEHMLGETSSTQFNQQLCNAPNINSALEISNYEDSMENINMDNINPLQSIEGREYVIDLSNRMKSSKQFKEVDDQFTPIKEDDENCYEISNDYDMSNSKDLSSFPSSICIEDFEKTNTKFDKAIDQLKDVLRSIDL